VYPADWRLLFYANTHSGSWLELCSTVGVMLAVFRLGLGLADRLPRIVRIVSSPGRLAFTIYVTHILARYVLIQRAATPSMSAAERTRAAAFESSTLLVFLLVAVLSSTLWSVLVGQGPLEWLLRYLSRTPLGRFANRGKRPFERPDFAQTMATDDPAVSLPGDNNQKLS
jgi:uncharacterized membrane protein YeiB